MRLLDQTFKTGQYWLKNVRVETLTTAPQAIAWLLGRGVFPEPADQTVLRAWAQEGPEALLALFHDLRADLRRLLTALQGQQPLPAPELARQQALLQSGSRAGAPGRGLAVALASRAAAAGGGGRAAG